MVTDDSPETIERRIREAVELRRRAVLPTQEGEEVRDGASAQLLEFTGHPLADVGVATVLAICDKTDPATIDSHDLEKVAEYLLRSYPESEAQPYLSCVFTMNSVYSQPSWTIEKRREASRELLYSFQKPPAEPGDAHCAISGRTTGRFVYRQHVPLLTGENVINFFPAGRGGMPITPEYLLALQALPLGGRRSHGRMLIVHSVDDPRLTLEFARRFFDENARIALLARDSGTKWNDAKAPRTLIIHSLTEIERERRLQDEPTTASISVYHLSNSGQGADIDVFEVPSQIVVFLRKALSSNYRSAWVAIQSAAWEKPKKKQKRDEPQQGDQEQWGPGFSRNFLYEDLFRLPQESGRFIRRYFLRRSFVAGGGSGVTTQLDLVSWNLTALFLREVIGMNRSRIEAIRTLADRLAEHVVRDNDRKLFQRIYTTNRYHEFRAALLNASRRRLKEAGEPLVHFEEYLEAFEHDDEAIYRDWRLTRDLILIRLIETLHSEQWFGKAPEILDEISESDHVDEAAAS